jgi:hypothetical protein
VKQGRWIQRYHIPGPLLFGHAVSLGPGSASRTFAQAVDRRLLLERLYTRVRREGLGHVSWDLVL